MWHIEQLAVLILVLCLAQAVKSLPWIQSQANLCGVCGVQSVTMIDFCLRTKVSVMPPIHNAHLFITTAV
jgi:hypothetical protein